MENRQGPDDGQINVGDIDETIDYAIYNDLLIHTFGIGTVEGGAVSYGLSKLDEDSLKSLAYNTEGNYFSVENREEMEESFGEIVGVTKKVGSIDLSFYLIIVIIALFIIKQYLPGFFQSFGNDTAESHSRPGSESESMHCRGGVSSIGDEKAIPVHFNVGFG